MPNYTFEATSDYYAPVIIDNEFYSINPDFIVE